MKTKTMKSLTIFYTILVTTCLLVVTPSAAQENVHYGDKVPTTEELIEQLKPKPAYKTRGIQFGENVPETKPSISLAINFAHDSYALTQSAIEQLAPLGEALKSNQLQSYSFAVEGHTDATGTDQYNLSLSEKRALVVGNYLYNNYGIEPTRLQLIGKGESELFDPSNPNAGINRRVKISTGAAIQN